MILGKDGAAENLKDNSGEAGKLYSWGVCVVLQFAIAPMIQDHSHVSTPRSNIRRAEQRRLEEVFSS